MNRRLMGMENGWRLTVRVFRGRLEVTNGENSQTVIAEQQ